jgi:FkbM family methyltransferase
MSGLSQPTSTAAQRAAIYQWRKRSVFLVTSLAWVGAFMFLQEKLRPIQVVRGGASSSASPSSSSASAAAAAGGSSLSAPSSAACGMGAPRDTGLSNNPTSVEWTARARQNVRFANDEKYEVAVYRNDFLGTTLWKEYWDLVDRAQWEPQTLTAIKFFLKDHRDAAYIDFGAWIGPTVLFAGLLCDHVYALEPDPLAFSALVANINANPDVAARTNAFFECINVEAGPLEMEGTGDSTSRMTGKLKWDRTHGQKWTVPCRTLPGFIADNGITNVRLIKMDVEGAEVYLLPSLKPWLAAFGAGKKPTILFSLHMPFWADNEKKAETDAKMKAVWEVMITFAHVYTDDGRPLSTAPEKWEDLCVDFCTYLLSDVAFTP